MLYKANAGILLHDLRNDWVDNLYMLMGQAYYFREVYDTAYFTFQYINYAFSPKESDGYDKTIGSNSNEGGNAFSISTKEKTSTTSKIFKTPPSRNESFLWLIRTYLARDEYPEAAGMIEILKADPLFPERLQPHLKEMQALWFYQQNMNDSAAFYLEKALVNADNREEKARWEYLIAQLYERTHKNDLAKEFYDRASQHTLNPILDVYARLYSIRQNTGDEKAIELNIAELLKMARKDRYTNYRDIIYYSIAQMELERKNTVAAKDYLLRSTRASIDQSADRNQKSRSFLLLADLSFQDAEYINARNYYDSVQNTDIVKDLNAFNNRKDVLARIAGGAEIIARQDSLQRIAALPEKERDDYIKKLVRKLRKQQGLKEDEPVVSGNGPVNPNAPPTELFDNNNKSDWYFYNPTLKSKGYTEFKGKWGTRPNVDNWRRITAVNSAMQQKKADADAVAAKGQMTADDAGSEEISYEALLKKLPLTPEKLNKSNDSIENAQIEMGRALMDGLEDYEAAIKTFESFVERFNYSNRHSEALFYLYYCYQKTGQLDKAAAIKKQMEMKYKDTEFEKKISAPGTTSKEDKDKEAMTKQYNTIYSLFIEGKFKEALALKKQADSLYSKNYWTPQLLYIQSVYFIRERQDDSAKTALQDVINLFPSSVLATKAQNMLDVLNRRKEIEDYLTNLKIERPAEDSVAAPTTTPAPPAKQPAVVVAPAAKKDTNAVAVKPPPVIKQPTPTAKKDSMLLPPPVPKSAFTSEPTTPHYILIVMTKVDPVFVNEAKNAFNRYNKQNFYNKTIDITSEVIDDNVKLVLMNNFENADAAMAYMEKVRKIAATEIVPWLPAANYKFSVISAKNLEILKASKDLTEYQKFLLTAFPGKFN
ncbi:MAG: hypothetical protein IPP79_17805 [Chitinophagaceae bacterium]|nr:hypothetical protein [Chitinophagaceae bacterium]